VEGAIRITGSEVHTKPFVIIQVEITEIIVEKPKV